MKNKIDFEITHPMTLTLTQVRNGLPTHIGNVDQVEEIRRSADGKFTEIRTLGEHDFFDVEESVEEVRDQIAFIRRCSTLKPIACLRLAFTLFRRDGREEEAQRVETFIQSLRHAS